jgi:hypothetical protein
MAEFEGAAPAEEERWKGRRGGGRGRGRRFVLVWREAQGIASFFVRFTWHKRWIKFEQDYFFYLRGE